MKIEIPHQDIAAKAHQLYLADGCCHGKDIDHWLRAEAELKHAHLNARAHAEFIPAVNEVKSAENL